MTICPTCHQEFTPQRGRETTQRYCSRRCLRRANTFIRNADVADTLREARHNQGVTRTCPMCQQPFTPWRGREATQRYCSAACRSRASLQGIHAAHPKIEHAPQECPRCHRTFQPRRAGQRFCSPLCARGHGLDRIPHGAGNREAGNEKRRQSLARRAAEGRPLQPKQPRTANPPVEPTSETESPPLPPLVELEDSPPDDTGTMESPAPLTLPLQGAAARNEWQALGDLREAQANRQLRFKEVRTKEARTIILAGQGSYLGVEGGALVVHQGRTHGAPAPERELLYPALHGVRLILWIGGHGYQGGTMTLAAAAFCQREGIAICVLDGTGEPLLPPLRNEQTNAQLGGRHWLD